jgi:hypothetical protein
MPDMGTSIHSSLFQLTGHRSGCEAILRTPHPVLRFWLSLLDRGEVRFEQRLDAGLPVGRGEQHVY